MQQHESSPENTDFPMSVTAAAFSAVTLMDVPYMELDGSQSILPKGTRVAVVLMPAYEATNSSGKTRVIAQGEYIATRDGEEWIAIELSEFIADC